MESIEYLALLVSIQPKAVMKAISMRKKQMAKLKEKSESPEKTIKINEDGKNEFGEIVNTTFYKDIEEILGKEASQNVALVFDDKIENKHPELDINDEDDDFVKEAKKIAKEYEDELDSSPIVQQDSIIF